jgi:hypothetical protein
MKATPLVNNLNAGEISPRIDARSDVEKYHTGCRVLENMVPFMEGGASRLPGTYYANEVKVSSTATRLIPFHFSTVQAYVIEFGNLYIRFYMDDGVIMDGISVYEIASPYATADLFKLKFVQSADVMYIFHPSYPPKKLTRTAHTSWTLNDFVAKIQHHFEITAITKANPAVVTVTWTDTGWAASTSYTEGDIVTNGNYHYYCLLSHTSGTAFSTDFAIGYWQRLDLPEAGDIVYIESVQGMTEVNNLFFTLGTVTDGAGTITMQLSGIDSSAYGAWTAGGLVQKAKYGTADNRPSCGAFFGQRLVLAGSNNEPQGLAASVSGDYEDFTEDATIDSASISYVISSGKVDRIRWMLGEEYLILGTTGGVWKFNLPVTPTTVPPSAHKHVFVGVQDIQPQTVGDFIFWVTRSGLSLRQLTFDLSTDKYRAPDMTRLARHITAGTSIATSGIVDMSYQQEPIPILWAVRADGTLLGFVCDIMEKVFAWFRVVTDGLFESVAAISQDGEEDQVWVVVNRTIGGSPVRMIEYFMPHEFYSQIKNCFFVHSGLSFDGGAAVNIAGITKANPAVVTVDAWPANGAGTDLVDGDKVMIEGVVGMTQVNQTYPLAAPFTVAGANKGALTFQLSGINSSAYTAWASGGTVKIVKNSFTTMDHLIGESVVALADGYPCPAETVAAGGNVTFDYYGNQVHAGLEYIPEVEPMKLDAGSQQGTARGKKQRIHKVTCCFYETGEGVKMGPTSAKLRDVGELDAGELNTKDVSFQFPGGWAGDATMHIRQTKPLPMTILALVPRLDVNED